MTFNDLNLNKALLNALSDLEFTKPTTIQQKVFSPIMAGKDVLGIAQTGTGKTFAYLLPMMNLWKYSKKRAPEILILVPTRELVAQVVEDVTNLATYTNIAVTGVYGETNIKVQMAAINTGVDIVVATPGRLLDLILNGTISSKSIKKLVIDEVDEMLNLGFRTQLQSIIDLLSGKRQTLMFSATITEIVELFIANNFSFQQRIEAAPTGSPLTNITQIGYKVPNFNTKVNFIKHLLSTDKEMTKVLIFTATKKIADELNTKMEILFPDRLAVIHSNKSQNSRFKTVEQFESGVCSILIATDVIARGLDVSAVSHVINMDVPPVPENYIHRIGRTGRAGQKGIAITFITEADTEFQQQVEELMGQEIPIHEVPEEVEISNILRPDEMPKINMKNIVVKKMKVIPKGQAFQEKSDKNKKVNIKVTREDAKKKKYGSKYNKEFRG